MIASAVPVYQACYSQKTSGMATRWCSLQLRCAAGSAGGKALHRGQRAAVGARVLPLSLRRLSGGGWRQPRPPPPRAQQQPNQTDQQDADLDPIERLVGKLFGRKALEDPTPGGLKRLSDEAAKELYPATVDQWADPLPGDSEDVAVLRQLLAQTQLEAAPLRLAFDADRDGWSADAFHAGVDGFGACLVVAETGAWVTGWLSAAAHCGGQDATVQPCPLCPLQRAARSLAGTMRGDGSAWARTETASPPSCSAGGMETSCAARSSCPRHVEGGAGAA